MTALLTADEAARLVPGEQLVIVRAGGVIAGERDQQPRSAAPPQDWVALTGPCVNPLCGDGYHEPAGCPDCRDGRRIVPLYTECHACAGGGFYVDDRGEVYEDACMEDDCDRGRVLVGRGSIEVVPVVDGDNDVEFERGWITVYDDGEVELWIPQDIPDARFTTLELTLDPLPVPGRDFGIVIDCTERTEQMSADGPIYNKYQVTRVDGAEFDPKSKHFGGCFLFVLDLDHDPYAADALQAYAVACHKTHPELASALRGELIRRDQEARGREVRGRG